ncbi:hypothetical protein DJ82_13815 [Halorubrum sp. Ib24]|nr:hypothetical protein DJ82_13815 [Halorubrum sp. Ib24]
MFDCFDVVAEFACLNFSGLVPRSLNGTLFDRNPLCQYLLGEFSNIRTLGGSVILCLENDDCGRRSHLDFGVLYGFSRRVNHSRVFEVTSSAELLLERRMYLS